MASEPVAQATEHNGLISSLQWHPQQRNLLATGGRDKTVRVWSVEGYGGIESTEAVPGSCNIQCLKSIPTMFSVGRVVWRPGFVGASQAIHCLSGCVPHQSVWA